VIERLIGYKRPGLRTVFLCGNHEEVLLRLLRGEAELLKDWLKFGGAECLASYGVDVAALKRLSRSEVLGRLREAVPRDHQRFLQAMGDTFKAGDYLFVHAGLRPGVPLEDQTQADLRWIREPFLEAEDEHGMVIVHGHTITEEVEVRANRIGIDTGAYRSGVLTALGLAGSDRWFIRTDAGS
jgi:serine/threonine protein phosphatase 1